MLCVCCANVSAASLTAEESLWPGSGSCLSSGVMYYCATGESVAMRWHILRLVCFYPPLSLDIVFIIHSENKMAPNTRPVGYWGIFCFWSGNGVTIHLATS